jgi:hypothetical protein
VSKPQSARVAKGPMNNTAIHYEGFTVVATNRLYVFSVDDASVEPRRFIVEITPSSFLPTRLKFQDGPAISLQRVKREIEQESPASPAKAHITISGQDVADYLVRQSPKKGARKRSDPAVRSV